MSESDSIYSTPIEITGEVAALALNAVPVVGGIISDIANSFIRSRQNKRLNRFLLDLSSDLQNVKNQIEVNRINSEEYQNVVEDIFDKASSCRQQNKLDAFRALFINITFADKPNYDEALEIASLIDRWQDRHILLLKILDNPQEANIKAGNVFRNDSGSFGSINQSLRMLLLAWSEDQIYRTWQDLYDAKIHTTNGTKTMMSGSGVQVLENRLSDYGKKVVSYIRNSIRT